MTKGQAQKLLERSIGPDAEFRPDQWEAIDALVNERERLLLVQRTGWGKSSVYFIATKLLRAQGAGPTLIISPLLALMRNQIEDAEQQLGLDAWTINSNNTDEWDDAKQRVLDGDCDVLLISPERLAKPEFRENILAEMEDEIGLLVIDEAHCISDWGHDFRPDYRRIKRILQDLPSHIPVAATTATANDRVIDDVTTQVPDLRVIRGDLMRDSLRIQTVEMDSRARRLAWLAENLGELPGSGIVYCLTTDEVEMVAKWLTQRGFSAKHYHGGMDGDVRSEREDQLLANEVDALVATNALGMGFNKPDLGWVVHFQRPPNLIRYYQEIGRAGRGLDEAYAVLLSGEEDDRIAEYFIEEAFPAPEDFETVLATIEESDAPLYKYEVLKRANVSWKAASKCLNILRVENALLRVEDGFERTSKDWQYDRDRFESITEQRWRELAQIQEFVKTESCLAAFIDDVLDGTMTTSCGQCANCTGPFLPSSVRDEALVDEAVEHYRDASWQVISARYYMPEPDGGRSKIADTRKTEDGRTLTVYGDPGLGELVREQRSNGEAYSQEVVDAAVEHIQAVWEPTPAPAWVTAVPSRNDDEHVTDLAQRIAAGLGVPYEPALRKVKSTDSQHELANSYQKRWNVEDAFEVTAGVRSDPVLLVDETVNSRWTLTEAGLTLRDGGSGIVYPFALAERGKW
ncbi:RecQ family ATP-dependent DNA helicase [Halorubrum sp. 2020YC2]|uniref:RecQ family ATP-dependent DNA helicase n=1 Tax=Halorubrum sp. 2020YC2 TaxID=2836432 RepID=UPI001BE6F442|nr:RecQ family ATP-dependent DNA helicase [Halorubrum sp. 2020YC2]QWC18049.1 RecQ family ATP-dependent DNA helicase [Halorubrum sp. 2020YC2]